jgi:hypothetical protein
MAHYDLHKPLVLAVYAFGYGLGAVISHTDGVQENPIAYASRTLTPAEKNYSQIGKRSISNHFWSDQIPFVLVWEDVYTHHRPQTLNQHIRTKERHSGVDSFTTAAMGNSTVFLPERATGKHQNADTLSRFPMACVESDSRTQFDRETEQIHKIKSKTYL